LVASRRRRGAALLRNNTRRWLGGTTRIFRADATKLGPAHPLEPFTLVFLDPPYARVCRTGAAAAREAAGSSRSLDCRRRSADAAFKAPDGFTELERRTYDDTELVFCAITKCRPAKAGTQ